MSKSLGNGLSVDQVLSQHPAWVVRYALVSVQYRSMLEWSDQSLQEAEGAYERIRNFVDRAGRILGAQPERVRVTELSADDLPEDFVQAMNDDINVSEALASVFALIRRTNTIMDQLSNSERANRESSMAEVSQALLSVRGMLDVFGLDPLSEQWNHSDGSQLAGSYEKALDTLVRARLDSREKARKAKDFKLADQIREELAESGITIMDTSSGPTWTLNC